jgi:hypothetical protein
MDDCFLSLQHIPHGKNGVADNVGPPVFSFSGVAHYNCTMPFFESRPYVIKIVVTLI